MIVHLDTSALVDALGPDGRDIRGLSRLVAALRDATAAAKAARAVAAAQGEATGVNRSKTLVYLERSPKKTFAGALDWPGWCRAGLALAALADYAPRYARVAAEANESFEAEVGSDFDVVEDVAGDATTAFGAPGIVVAADRRPVSATDGERMARLVAAAWAVFEDVAAGAPQTLRKGPRGGGRDRDKIVEHVVGAETSYASVIGIKRRQPDPGDRAAIDSLRAAILDLLAQPSDGTPLAGRRWPARYAARRIAWHALDHAWEIEDRTEPA